MIALPFLFLSVAIHVLMGYGVSRLPPPGAASKNEAVEVVITERTPKEQRQIVRQALIPPSLLVPPTKDSARFLSERDQRVTKEQKSRNTGLTTNGNTDRAASEAKAGGPKTEQAKQETSESGINPVISGRTLNQMSQELLMTSRNSDYLPDVSEGPITALNSERFIYYSFFSRVEERIRPLWERAFQDALRKLPLSEQSKLSGKEWRTVIEVVIDPQGHHVESLITHTSGVKVLDETPLRAFREASFFPNPPNGLVQADGKVHLKWGFTHIVDDGTLARRSSP